MYAILCTLDIIPSFFFIFFLNRIWFSDNCHLIRSLLEREVIMCWKLIGFLKQLDKSNRKHFLQSFHTRSLLNIGEDFEMEVIFEKSVKFLRKIREHKSKETADSSRITSESFLRKCHITTSWSPIVKL